MIDIPDDVMTAAKTAYYSAFDDNGEATQTAVHEAIARAIMAERNRSRWQPIETAPKDGTNIIAWFGIWKAPHIVHWRDGESAWCEGSWCWSDGPIHWQPLPEPPEAT